jgi:uncharacterized protein
MPLRVVLDTNVLLVSLSSRSPYHWAFRAVVEGAVTLCLTTEIALEYEEVVARHMGRTAADALGGFLDVSRHVEWVRAPYRWRLVPEDPEDDKFVDCAIAAGATLVTEDRHFEPLREIDFPRVEVLGVGRFRRMLLERGE